MLNSDTKEIHLSSTCTSHWLSRLIQNVLEGYTCRTFLTAPLACPLCALSSRCILGIKTSFKMSWWDRFLGHQQKDGGGRRGTEKKKDSQCSSQCLLVCTYISWSSPSSVFDLLLWLVFFLSWSVCLNDLSAPVHALISQQVIFFLDIIYTRWQF